MKWDGTFEGIQFIMKHFPNIVKKTQLVHQNDETDLWDWWIYIVDMNHAIKVNEGDNITEDNDGFDINVR